MHEEHITQTSIIFNRCTDTGYHNSITGTIAIICLRPSHISTMKEKLMVSTSHPLVNWCADLNPPAEPFLGALHKKKHTNEQTHS